VRSAGYGVVPSVVAEIVSGSQSRAQNSDAARGIQLLSQVLLKIVPLIMA
jgi:hypothetical protein